MRNKLNLILIFLITSQITPVYAAINPQEISISLQSDGVTRLDYLFEAEVTSLQTNVTLLGENIQDLFILNEDGLPLEYEEADEVITIYSLGSSLVNLSYLTSDLTGKNGVIWSLSVEVPVSTEILLPIGATIINLNTIPLSIDTVDERTDLIMPAGQVEIQYTIDIIDSETLAQAAIDIAQAKIKEAENNGIIVTDAQNKLDEAKAFYQQESFLDAEDSASSASNMVEEIVEKKNLAEAKITATEAAIEIAEESSRTIGLDEAESLLSDAEAAYQQGDYDQALIYAEQALELVLNTEKPRDNTVFYAAGLVLVLGIGAYLITRRKTTIEHVPVQVEIDLERLFNEHPELRMDDREVLKYLAENDGEAFAFDIRDRFDIPRTSAWRMIQRLQRYEVVDERKIGGQSLIRIKEEYRRQP